MEAWDARLLEKAKSACSVTDEFVVICSKVHQLVNGSKASFTFLATQDALFLVGKSDRKRVVSSKFHWHEITKIKVVSETQVQKVHQTDSAVLWCRSAARRITKLVGYIENVMIESERPSFEGEIELVAPIKHMSLASYFRFSFLLCREGRSAPKEVMSAMKRMVEVGTEYDFCRLNADPELSDLLVQSILAEPSVTSVSIPANPKRTIWPALATLIEMNMNPSLKQVTVGDVIDADFQKVVAAFKAANGSSPIEEIVFTGADWGKQRPEVFLEFVAASQIRKLTMCWSCSFEWIVNALKDLRTHEVKHDKLRCLALKGMEILNIAELYQSLGDIKCLVLVGCVVDVSDAFNQLSESHLESITVCDSLAQMPINKETCLPDTLTSIAFERVTWEQTTFVDTWHICTQHKPTLGRLELNFAGATVDNTAMEQMFSEIQGTASDRICKVVWDMNPIYSNFIQFLGMLPNLKLLSVSGCMTAESTKEIAEFTGFLRSNQTVTELTMNGIDEAVLGPAIVAILKALQQNRVITSLTVCNQRFGIEGLMALSELLAANRAISHLVFTGNNIGDLLALRSFFETVAARGAPLQLGSTIKALIDISKCNDCDIEAVERFYRKITQHTNAWVLPYPPIPTPSTEPLVRQMEPKYTLGALVQAFYKSQ